MKVLVLNAGSSSQKSCLYQLNDSELPQQAPEPIWKASIDGITTTDISTLKIQANRKTIETQIDASDRTVGITQMLATLVEGETKVIETLNEIDIIGHRVVHGGTQTSQATLVTPEIKEAIEQLIPLAPTHNPAHLEEIAAIDKLFSNLPQVAVFDTAFHSQMPPEACIYPIPYEWFEKGIRRYGFHGISHQYCAHKAAQILGKPLESLKLITCHLGNGCSLAAIKNGIGINTTMGFTPLEGIMMGSRSGSIDPAIPLYLIRDRGLKAEEINEMLNKKSGLKGISGISADMRQIIQAIAQGNERAQLAFDMYIHRLKSAIGSMLASLGGLDALIFTAGVGENNARVREKACEGLEFLGLKLDKGQNESQPVDKEIATPDSAVKILVIHTEEDWAIAQECWKILKNSPS